MAALTLATLNTQVRELVGDPVNVGLGTGAGANTYSDAQIADAINWAIQYVCDKMDYTYQETMVIQAVGAVPLTFPLANGVLPSGVAQPINDYLSVKRVMTGGSPHLLTAISLSSLLMTTEAEEDAKNPAWRSYSSGTIAPRRWLFLDGATIVLVPTPTTGNSGANFVVTVGYTQKPTALANNTDVVDSRIPWPVQNYLKYAAGAWLKQLGGQDQQSLTQSTAWLEVFNKFAGIEE